MATKTDYDTENPFRYPLGLPSGSVRALLTLIVVGVTCTDIVKGIAIKAVWAETLMVALAHYFTSRRFVQLPPELLRKLEADDIIPKEPLPLYLPRGTIRLLILGSFIGVAVYQFRQGLLAQPSTFAIFITLLAYFAGTTVRGVLNWWSRGKNEPQSRWWADAKAITVLVALIVTSLLQIVGSQSYAPQWLENITMAMVLFYFGSR
ncbi:MAG: hypothetical protein V4719_31110 [Planctomycetota bacterium]